jgi:hypothetical protein
VYRFTGKCVLVENFRKFICVSDRLNKNNYLIELKLVDQVHEFSDLFISFELDVVLL